MFISNCSLNKVIKHHGVHYLDIKEKQLVINLEDQEIIDENKKVIKFEIDSFRKKCLLEGLDDIALTLKKTGKISEFEKRIKINQPWL